MIIERIHAINILKYAELKLDYLPKEGLIAISGLNESGKSTIGETVCFALFGRTFSLGFHETDKILRWGELQCSATVGFEVKGEHYELSRFLDREGNHSAKLTRVGDAQPCARGVTKVADAVLQLLGFEFEEFIESFYLAQREITTPHPHSHAVKIMAGVAPMEMVINECNQEIEDYREKIGELGAELETVEQELRELKVKEGLLISIEDERTVLDHRVGDNRRTLEALEAGLADYTEIVPLLEGARRARGGALVFRVVFFLLAAIAAGIWGLLTQAAQQPATSQIKDWLARTVPEWQAGFANYIGLVAVVFALLFVLAWFRVSGKREMIQQLTADAAAFAEPLALARKVEDKVIADDSLLGEKHREGKSKSGKQLERPDQARFHEIHARVLQAAASADEINAYTAVERDWVQNLLLRQSLHVSDLDQVIEDETARIQQAAQLHEVIASLNGQRKTMQHHIRVRHKSIELLEGASRHQSGHFNRDIRELVGRMLPLFTDGRYEHLKIGDDLTVQVFSSDKRDFMELDEVSSGTQRQIMLAVRLALSQKLLDRAVKGKQFAFLDEPFAFFDEARTRKALNALKRLDNDISQIWIVAQSFPADELSGFAMHIDCGREIGVLALEG